MSRICTFVLTFSFLNFDLFVLRLLEYLMSGGYPAFSHTVMIVNAGDLSACLSTVPFHVCSPRYLYNHR